MPSRRPPVPPPSTAPPSVPLPDPSKYRSKRQNELEELRQRGLAKLLNKHFTDATKTISAERAAADAALKELEMRKAAGMGPVEADYSGLSNYDELYLELQQKKAECKRKEKETLLLYQRYVNKFGNTGAVGVPTMSGDNKSVVPATMPRTTIDVNGVAVPRLAGEIESNLEKHIERGAERHPSIKHMGVDDTYQTKHASVEDQERKFRLRTVEGKGVDARTSPSPKPSPKKLMTPTKSPSSDRVGFPDKEKMLPPPPLLSTPASRSTSETEGETTTNSSTPVKWEGTPDAKAREHKPKPGPDSWASETFSVPTVDTTDLEGDGSDASNRSADMSELTSDNLTSDAELRLVEFIKTETETIRQMMEEEETMSVASKTSMYSTDEFGTQSQRAARQAEDMCREMQKILQEAQDDASVHTEQTSKHEPRNLETGNPNEDWKVYWDDTHQREYYHEVNSNTVTWDKPETATRAVSYSKDETFVPMADYTKTSKSRRMQQQALSYEDLMPETQSFTSGRSSGSTRRDIYRKAQRRKRNRRRLFVAVSATAVVGGTVYWKNQQGDDMTYGKALGNVVDVQKNMVNNAMSHVKPHLPETLQWYDNETFIEAVVSNVQPHLPEALQIENPREQANERAERKEKERKAKEAAALKAKKATEKKAKEEAAKKAKKVEGKKAKEEEVQKAREEESRLQLSSEKKQEEEATALAEKKIPRPWGCNIPLAYLVSGKCRRLAKSNPVFDLKELISAMMQ